jgi:hypothetical protein
MRYLIDFLAAVGIGVAVWIVVTGVKELYARWNSSR